MLAMAKESLLYIAQTNLASLSRTAEHLVWDKKKRCALLGHDRAGGRWEGQNTSKVTLAALSRIMTAIHTPMARMLPADSPKTFLMTMAFR